MLGDVTLIERKTQNPAYWGDEFTVTLDDTQFLTTLLLDDELPRSTEELGQALVTHRCRQEEALIEQAMSKGTLYQPKNSHEIGSRVVFPALSYRIGEVTGVRPGQNPEYGSFQVIQVQFEEDEVREFASQLTSDHSLNHEARVDGDEGQHSAEELTTQYGAQVGKAIEEHLEADPDFVRLASKWFRRDLLIEVHIGHLNLAEAVLDVEGGGPLPTEALLGDLELPEEVTPQLRVFSLNHALQEDDRFDEVGPAGEVLWFLRRLEPEGVQSVPPHIQYQPMDYDPALLTSEMLALERTLDDEWSNLDSPEDVSEPVTVVLTHPHWRSGTLPLTSHLSQVFPTGRTERIRFTFVDGNTGEEMPGWVVSEGRYVYGLKEWYEENAIPVGTYLELERGKKPGEIVVRARRHRPRREWIRVALAVDGRLAFEMRKKLIACEYDELMVVGEENAVVTEMLWTRAHEAGTPLNELIDQIFPELAKLSPQGTVHAATLYSAVNVTQRTPPGPLLAALVSSGIYAPVGDNYWVLQSGPR